MGEIKAIATPIANHGHGEYKKGGGVWVLGLGPGDGDTLFKHQVSQQSPTMLYFFYTSKHLCLSIKTPQ